MCKRIIQIESKALPGLERLMESRYQLRFQAYKDLTYKKKKQPCDSQLDQITLSGEETS